MVSPVGFPMVMIMEIGKLVLPGGTRAGITMLTYAVIGKMVDVDEEINAVSIMVGIMVKSRFVLISRKDAVLEGTVANLIILQLMPRRPILSLTMIAGRVT